MSSPNELGHPGPGDNAGSGDGLVERTGPRAAAPTGRLSESGEAPPWQRGASRTQQSGPARAPKSDPPTREIKPEPRPAPAESENRISRYVTGTAAPAALQQQNATATTTQTDANRNKEYASELPDLSGPMPRPPQRRESPEREQPGTSRPSSGARVQVAPRAKAGPVRASMQIRRIDPWSTLKVSLLLSVALFFVWMIAVAFLYLVLGGMGVWSKLNSNVGDLLTSTSGSGGELVSSGTIFGGALLIGLLNIVVLTAMATIGAFIYNLSTDIVGGVEVTLADRE
ncbi:DUF3566 domain-containing protein [Mycobacterium sp. ACS4331]|uniref:DUF3566 domain-containing protein n=1 Tax=Mycobacterium sp. ACS4331 TaxID=1834121 RepID=UPI0007FF98EE|nr:DUF3566 domain-containing protein [Mycobacterium sp. ACS4331]OBF23121.1 hypothetical protein A5727_07140 [Mycobacterium sp. ACS4331]